MDDELVQNVGIRHFAKVTFGLEPLLVQPSVFRHPTFGVVMEAHVDDIEITGPDEEVDTILQRLGEIFLLKVAPHPGRHELHFFSNRGLENRPQKKES